MTLVERLRHSRRLPQLLCSKLTHEFVQPIAPVLLLLQERFVEEPFQVALGRRHNGLGRRQCKAALENGTTRQDLRFLRGEQLPGRLQHGLRTALARRQIVKQAIQHLIILPDQVRNVVERMCRQQGGGQFQCQRNPLHKFTNRSNGGEGGRIGR